MKKWILLLGIFCLLVIIGKAWSSGIFGFMQPPSFHESPVSGDTRVTTAGDTRVDTAGNTRVIQ